MVVEIEQLGYGYANRSYGRDINIDEGCKHRPEPQSEKQQKKRGRKRKQQVSAYTSMSDLDDSDCDWKEGKRPCKFREKNSETFKKSLSRALDKKGNFKISSMKQNGDNVQVVIKSRKTYQLTTTTKHIFWTKYQCNLSRSPPCDCPFYIKQKGNKTCKHIIWLMLKLLNCREDDEMLHQRGYTAAVGKIANIFTQWNFIRYCIHKCQQGGSYFKYTKKECSWYQSYLF